MSMRNRLRKKASKLGKATAFVLGLTTATLFGTREPLVHATPAPVAFTI
jgi:hypothetical protein